MTEMIRASGTYKKPKYEHWLTNELIEYVRNVPNESDALVNIVLIMKQYEKRKTFWQKLKALFY